MQKIENYTLGYDLGNKTVASTAINSDFNIVKYKNRLMTQINLFEEGKSKEKRRGYRSTRRNNNHKKWLKKQLINWFEANSDFDIDTLIKYYHHSWVAKSDLDHHKPDIKPLLTKDNHYPTVWHAANALITHTNLPTEYKDVQQLIFEVFYNLLNRRGHFLLPQLTVEQLSNKSFDFMDLSTDLQNEIPNLTFDSNKFNDILTSNKKRADKEDELSKLFKSSTLNKILAKFILSYKLTSKNINQLFPTSQPNIALTFNKTDTDDIEEKLSAMLTESEQELFNTLKAIQVQTLLTDIIPANKTFIEGQIEQYNQFGKDLHKLTTILNKYDPQDKTIKAIKTDLHKYTHGHLKYDDFIKSLKSNLKAKPLEIWNQQSTDWQQKITSNKYLTKPRSIANRKIPQQAIQGVIRQIIDSQKDFWPALKQNKYVTDPWFPGEKYDLERFYDFKIPYYIGPLVPEGQSNPKFGWLIRKESGKLTVFNFTDKIDYPKTAQKFIQNLIGYDTQLLDEHVMAANTITYQKFNVYNELSNLKIHKVSRWTNLTGEQKQFLFNSLFTAGNTVHKEQILNVLNSHYGLNLTSNDLTGFTDINTDNPAMNSSMKTLKKLHQQGLTDNDIEKHFNDVEEIIEYLTAFDKDSRIIKNNVLEKYTWLKPDIKIKLAKVSFDGYGNLSKKLLHTMVDKDGHNILWYLSNTSMNYQQIIKNKKLGFNKQIQEHQQNALSGLSQKEKINRLLGPHYINPAVKKMLNKFTANLQYYIKTLGQPNMIVIESARGSNTATSKNDPRYTRVKKIFTKLANQIEPEVRKNFNNFDKHDKLTTELYLYFLQNGKDIYDQKPIDFNRLQDSYDIDHTIPQAVMKNNSLNNLVLTSNINNSHKSNHRLVVNTSTKMWWKSLVKQGLMTKEKYQNLTTDWTDPKATARFLNRSLVETNQINKLAANIATIMCPNAKVLLLNSNITVGLRHKYDIAKNRNVNDLHHGVDSYLIAFSGQYLYNRYSWSQPILDYNDYNKIDKPVTPISKYGFNELDSNPVITIVNKSTGEIIGNSDILRRKLERLKYPDLFNKTVNYEIGPQLVGNAVYGKTTVHAKPTPKELKKSFNPDNKLQIKNGRNIKLYGYRTNFTHRYFVIVKDTKHQNYRLVWIPITKEHLNNDQLTNYIKSNVNYPFKICSPMLPVGTKLHLDKTNFEFRVIGQTSIYITKQLLLPNSDVKLINQIEKKNLENITRNNLEKIYHDIIDYEKRVNGYLINVQKKNITPLFTNIQTSKDKQTGKTSAPFKYLESLSTNELTKLVPQLLTLFHCDGKIMTKTIKGVTSNRLKMSYWNHKLIVQK